MNELKEWLEEKGDKKMKKKLLEMAAELLKMANETKMEEIENQGATLYISSNENKAPQVQAEEQGTYNIISGKHLIKVKVISVENAPINPKYPFYVISGNTLYAHEFGKTTFLPVQEALQKYIRQISHL